MVGLSQLLFGLNRLDRCFYLVDVRVFGHTWSGSDSRRLTDVGTRSSQFKRHVGRFYFVAMGGLIEITELLVLHRNRHLHTLTCRNLHALKTDEFAVLLAKGS